MKRIASLLELNTCAEFVEGAAKHESEGLCTCPEGSFLAGESEKCMQAQKRREFELEGLEGADCRCQPDTPVIYPLTWCMVSKHKPKKKMERDVEHFFKSTDVKVDVNPVEGPFTVRLFQT